MPEEIDLVGMYVKALRDETEFTVLTRDGGTWKPHEISQLVHGLNTECQQLPKKPEAVILFGGYSEAEVIDVISADDFEHQIVIGYNNPDLPFRPTF